jgi:hypothetical protein
MADAPPMTEALVKRQTQETVDQEAVGVTVRMATITCGCGWERGITDMYKCLYCGQWLCHPCAEQHFGQTVAEYPIK